MTKQHALIGPHLRAFFSEHLCHHKRLSPATIASCRDTFRLLLVYLRDTTGIEPSALGLQDLDAPVLLGFLDYLEQQRGNSVRSRNIRLSALRSFFRLVALRDPENVDIVTRVLAIPRKREDKKLIGYLTKDEMEALLAAPDRRRRAGRRDHALLLTMYNSGARVSEITALKRDQVRLDVSTFLHLKGKGRKERVIPLWPHTARVLRAWFDELGETRDPIAFPNARGKPLSRYGVQYLLQRAVKRATATCPSLASKSISPHTIRHGTAMALLQAGVDIATIALWLGHESIETTHIYLQSDLATKERALAKLDPATGSVPRFTADDPLLTFLTSL